MSESKKKTKKATKEKASKKTKKPKESKKSKKPEKSTKKTRKERTKKEKQEKTDKESKAPEKKGKEVEDKKPQKTKKQAPAKKEEADSKLVAKATQMKKDAEKWLSTAKNTADIEFLSMDTNECSLTFQFKEEECEFAIRFPKEDDDLFSVSSDHLDPSFGEKCTEAAMAVTRIQDVLKITTEQFQDLSGEEFSEGDFGFDDEDDVFAGEDAWETEVVKKKEPKEDDGPEIDESAFTYPSGYEPAAIRSIINEYRLILKEGSEALEFEATPLGSNIAQWEIKLRGIPKDDPLWKDMKKMKVEYITMHVTFPPSYPFAPPFFRVVRPRFAFRTGHVTVGGAICTKLLSNEGWTASYRIANILIDIRAMFTAGGGRLDKSNRSDYTESEAMVAFERLLRTHGWTHWKK